MRFDRVLRMLIVAAVCALCACSAAPAGQTRLRPVIPLPTLYTVEGDALVYRQKGLALRMTALRKSDLHRYPGAAWLSEQGRGIQAFTLHLENRGTERVTFHSAKVALLSDKEDWLLARDYTDLYSAVSGHPEGSRYLALLSHEIFDGTTQLRSGERKEGLLLFSSPNAEAKQLRVLIGDLYVGSEPTTIPFPFQRIAEDLPPAAP